MIKKKELFWLFLAGSESSNSVRRFILYLFLFNPGEFSLNPDVPAQVKDKQSLIQANNGVCSHIRSSWDNTNRPSVKRL